jgi:mannobiose 2-epimerase
MEKEMNLHLKNTLLPFWASLLDDRGGFYGYVNFNLQIDKDAPKGVILNSRILWFFSNYYLLFKDENSLKYAEHAYRFLIEHCYDNQNNGVFWMLDKDGNVLEDVKYTYNQAFAVYALSSFYDASRNKEALDYALKIFDIIEEKAFDGDRYKEAFTNEWGLIRNDALSGNGVCADRTMNTVLHRRPHYG